MGDRTRDAEQTLAAHELAARVVGRYAKYCEPRRRHEIFEAFMCAGGVGLIDTVGPREAYERADHLALTIAEKVAA